MVEPAVGEDGADVIVLGCTGMSPVAAALGKKLPRPVVDPAAALTMAESLVQMNLSHSERCYLPEREILGEQFKDRGF